MSKKPALTAWYPASVTPARKGVYERVKTNFTDKYSLWNGRLWMRSDETPHFAAHDNGGVPSMVQDLAWRGLAEKPQHRGS